MITLDRRAFLTTAALTGTALLAARLPGKNTGKKRLMTLDLRCGSLGVRADQMRAVELAERHGFESLEARPGDLGKLSAEELERFLRDLSGKGLVLSAAGLGVDFRGDESRFRRGMGGLPEFARSLERARVTRVGTWLRPSHGELTYRKNFRLHVERLRQIARLLADHGLRLGLEYVGPKTSWSRGLHPFVHTLAETRELIAEIDIPTVGVVLDAWHWYNARETTADLRALRNRDIVAVDLNDAPAGIPIDEQVDHRRELPAATGVIDVGAFLNTLNELRYDGPVRAEPFNEALRKLPPDEAVAATARAMKKAFALIES